MKILDNNFDMDQIAKLLRVHTPSEHDDAFIDNNFCECSDELQAKDECECGFQDEREFYSNTYQRAIETTADNLLREHGMTLVPANKRFGYWQKKIIPMHSWKDAAEKLVMTINGYGMFEFRNARVLKESGPYVSYEQAVLNHIGWINSWYQVYGYGSAESKISSLMR